MKRRRVAAVACLVAAAAACSKGNDKNAGESKESETKVGQVNVETDPLASLQLSSSLSAKVPESVAATGAGVEQVQSGKVAVATLTADARKKSQEACNIRQKIKEAKGNQESVAMQLCYFEVQKGLNAGHKYHMKFTPPQPEMEGAPGMPTLALQDPPPGGDPTGGMDPGGDPTGGTGGDPTGGMGGDPTGGGATGGDPTGGDPTGGMPDSSAGGDAGGGEVDMSLFLDNSVENQLSVFVCSEGKLVQKVTVSGSATTGSKGSYKVNQSMGGMGQILIQGAFDNGVDSPGHQRSFDQSAFDMSMGDTTMKMRSTSYLDLVADGVSTVKVANEMAGTGDFAASFREIGAALIGPNLGSALFQRSIDANNPGSFGPDAGGQQTPPMGLTEDAKYQTSRSFFDSAGQTLKKEDADNFADGGLLDVKDDLLPQLVPDSFTVAFDPGDWDCSGAEEFTMDTSALQSCMDKFASSFQDETCTDTAFTPGVEVEAPSVLDQRAAGAPELPPPPTDVPPPPAP